jgi:hypothetical protein
MKQERFTAARIDASACQSRRARGRLLPLVATLLFSAHGTVALAGDIARDTPAASMALAAGLYATPGTSTSVSVSAPPPVVIASALPAKVPESTTNWISYVALIAGIVGAITGIAGAIMGALSLRRASRH